MKKITIPTYIPGYSGETIGLEFDYLDIPYFGIQNIYTTNEEDGITLFVFENSLVKIYGDFSGKY